MKGILFPRAASKALPMRRLGTVTVVVLLLIGLLPTVALAHHPEVGVESSCDTATGLTTLTISGTSWTMSQSDYGNHDDVRVQMRLNGTGTWFEVGQGSFLEDASRSFAVPLSDAFVVTGTTTVGDLEGSSIDVRTQVQDVKSGSGVGWYRWNPVGDTGGEKQYNTADSGNGNAAATELGYVIPECRPPSSPTQLTVIKQTFPTEQQKFWFTLDGTWETSVGVPGNLGSYTWDVEPGTFKITELITKDRIAAGWRFIESSCDNDDDSDAVTLAEGDHVTCTFINMQAVVDIEKATNGEDADSPTGPSILVGDPVNWTYVVSNKGTVPLTGVTVVDDQDLTVSCPQTTLAVFESMTCTASGVAELGQYANLGKVTTDQNVSDEDPSHYVGYVEPLGSITVYKWIDGPVDAELPTGPEFTFNLTGQADRSVAADSWVPGQWSELTAGTYNLTEQVLSGWDFVEASCRIEQGTVASLTAAGTSVGNPAVIELGAGEHVICDFWNEEEPPPPTTTTTAPTTTTEPPTTTTTTDTVAVLGVQISTTTVAVSAETLPFTGANLGEGGMAGIALALLALGGVALLAVRRREEEVVTVAEAWSDLNWDVE